MDNADRVVLMSMTSTTYGKRHLPADIGRSLKLGRQRRGWSLRTAERRLGVSFGYLCHLENGNRVPSSVFADLLSTATALVRKRQSAEV